MSVKNKGGLREGITKRKNTPAYQLTIDEYVISMLFQYGWGVVFRSFTQTIRIQQNAYV